MTKPKKHLVTKKTLWTARKAGSPTGYGATPLLAYRDAMRRKEKTRQHQESIARLIVRTDEQVKERLAASYAENRELQDALNRQTAQTHELQRALTLQRGVVAEMKRREEMKAQGARDHLAKVRREADTMVWVAIAMAHFGTTNPGHALDQARKAGIPLSTVEVDAGMMVRRMVEGWKEHLGAPAPAAPAAESDKTEGAATQN